MVVLTSGRLSCATRRAEWEWDMARERAGERGRGEDRGDAVRYHNNDAAAAAGAVTTEE